MKRRYGGSMTLTRRALLAATSAAMLFPGRARAIATRAESVLHWQGSGPFFGGFSAIELNTDRNRALLISDRGFAVRLRLLRDAQGALTSVEKIDHFTLRDLEGAPLGGHNRDAEGMDQRPDGTLFIAFESPRSRIWRYDDERGRARAVSAPSAWRGLPGNQGIEALAIDARGVIHALPETAQDGGFAVWRLTDDWRIAGRIPQRGAFVPVGADFGPDGNLYLLERRFRVAFFATRISRLRPGAWDQPETLVQTPMGALDNHEGIAVARDADGVLWATTVSDDNQRALQRTEIAEFRLT